MSEKSSPEITIFLAAIEKDSPPELAAYLDQACGADRQLRARVESLVAAHRRDSGYLERPVPQLDRTVDVNREAMDAGLAPAFGTDAAVVIGGTGHSVLKSLSKKLPEVPHVTLHDSQQEPAVIVPGSKQLPTTEDDSRYQLLGEIARGGMGAIIKGRDRDLGRDLAIKVLLDSHKDKPEIIQRFLEEAQVGGQLQHPGIVPVYELGQFRDERPFFSMKLVKGQTLAALLAQRRNPSEDVPKLLGIFEQICQTMAYAHSKGVIHRDLKPANIMVGAFGEVQVMDWGLAKVLAVGGVADEQKSLDKHHDVSVIQTRRSMGSDAPGEAGSQTRMGSVMGTPAYMPPEQALGEIDRLDARADVFGLGAILAEILTGKPPYVAENSTNVFRLATRGKLDACVARLDACGAEPELIELAKHALSPDPDDRPRNAGQLSAAVTHHLEGVQERLEQSELARVAAQARSEEEGRRKKLYVAIAGLMLVLAAAGAVAASFYKRHSQTQQQLAEEQTRNAEVQRQAAEENAQLAALEKRAKERAEAEARRANVLRLATESEKERAQFPVRSALLALEAAQVTRRHDGTILPAALDALLNSSIELHGPPLQCQSRIVQVAVSRDGNWLATKAPDHVRVWNLRSDRRPFSYRELRGHTPQRFGTLQSVAFSPDSRQLATGGGDTTARLWSLSGDGPSSLVFRGHAGGVSAVAISLDGRWLATGSGDTTVRLWDLSAPDPTTSWHELRGHQDTVNSLVFSEDGRWLASCCGRLPSGTSRGNDNTVRVWDLSESPGERSLVLPGNSNAGAGPERLAFGPHSRWLLASGYPARLWDLELEHPETTPIVFPERLGDSRRVAISPDGKWLATGGEDVWLWRLADGGLGTSPLQLVRHETIVADLEFSRDGRWLAESCYDNTARIWDMNSADIPESVTLLRVHEDLAMDLSFSPDSSALVTGSRDGTAHIRDLTENNPVSDRVVRVPQGQLQSVAFSPNMRWLVAGNAADATIQLWRFADGMALGPPIVLHGYRPDTSWGMKISPDGDWLAAGDEDVVRVWDMTADNLRDTQRKLAGHRGPVRFLEFDPHCRWLVTSSSDQSVGVWDLSAPDPSASVIMLDHDGDDAHGLAVSPNGKWLAAIANIGPAQGRPVIRLWNFHDVTAARQKAPAHVIELTGEGANLCLFSPDSEHLVASTTQGRLIVVDLQSDSPAETARYVGAIQQASGSICFTPDSKTAITIGRHSKVQLWDMTDPEQVELRELVGHRGYATWMAADAQVQRLVTTAADRTARVWDLTNVSAPPLVLRGHATRTTCDISPDGRWVVTASADKLRIWDMDVEATLARAQQIAGRQLTSDERTQYKLAP